MIAEILPGNLWLVIKLLPLLALAAVLFGVFGWCLRRKFHAPVVSSSKPSTPDDLPARERAKKLEHALAKSEAGHKSLQLEFAALQAKSVSKQALDKVSKDLADAQHRVDADLKRIQALEAELKKSRETLNTLNSSSAEANKGQRDRTFVLENELSKTREALALLEARPDNSLALQAEVDRLRETLTNSTRVIGELRKLETTYAQALAKTQAQLDAATQASTATATDAVSLLPAMEAAERNLRQTAAVSTKIAAAKEAVERLQALNAQKEAERLAAEQAAAQAELIRLATEQAAAAAQAELAAVAAQAELAAAAAQAELAAAAAQAAAAAAAEQAAAEQAAAAAEQAAAAAQAEQAAAAAQAEQAAAVAQAEQAERDRLVAEQAAAAQAEVAVEPEPPVVEPAAIQQAELELIQPTRLPLTPTEQPQAAN